MKDKKLKKKLTISSRIKGTKDRPRLSVFRSNKYIYGQIIDDSKGETLVGVSEKDLKTSLKKEKNNKTHKAKELGSILAKKAIEKKIERVIFARGIYRYHGRIKSFIEGAREGGLSF